MARGSVRIYRVDALKKKLNDLRGETAQAVKPAVQRAAELVVTSQRHLAPVGETGDLRASIRWYFDEAARKGRDNVNETRAIIKAGSKKVRYAYFVERGALGRPAQPFFFPGYRANKKRVKSIIAAAVRRAVKGAAA